MIDLLRYGNPGDSFASDSPVILQLKMLETKYASAGRLPDNARKSAANLVGALKRSVAARPSLTLLDIVAKLKTFDEMAQVGIGEKTNESRRRMVKSAATDLRRPLAAL